MPELYVYAELLLHIRQLTLYASLSEGKDKGTQILISSDKKVITAVYGNERASIYLPTQIKGTANVTFPLGKRTELSTKLQIDDQNELQQAIDASPSIQVPWTASSLLPGVTLQCKACSAVVVTQDTIIEWKDLPSENWAELMDLWFCHKPQENDHDDAKAAESRGFSAQSRVMNEPRTGLVDTMSFVLHSDDSGAVQAQKEQSLNLICSKCSAFLGIRDAAESSHRLFKSRIQIEGQSFDSGIFIGAQMLHLIENNISRRVVVHDDSRSGLLCWVFNPDIYYSSSKRGATVHRALKVFYEEVEDPANLLDENSTTLEELALPTPEFDALKQTLVASREFMPVSAREFQNWTTALLDRYEENDTGLGAMDQNALNHQAGDIELFKLPEGWAALYE